MDYKTIVNLMKEMSNTELTKVEIEEAGFRICLEKGGLNVPIVTGAVPAKLNAQSMASTPEASQKTVTVDAADMLSNKGSQDILEEQNHKRLVSPMVGTFYTQPSPDKPPFVKVGDKVKKGQTVCIIEAMKLLNEIESEHDGEIVKILINNEEMVEFGQPLFLIKV